MTSAILISKKPADKLENFDSNGLNNNKISNNINNDQTNKVNLINDISDNKIKHITINEIKNEMF